MGYRRMTKEDIYEILRRWHDGQNVSRISEVEECDRKTICKYIQKFNEAGFLREVRSSLTKKDCLKIFGQVKTE